MNTLFTLTLVLGGQPAPSALQSPAPIADRGDVKAGVPLRHTFELAHRGPAGTITITRVEGGCGCLRQVLTAAVLRPGDTARLTLEVNTLTQPDGPNRWQARVAYQLDVPGMAPQPGELQLQIAARVSREVAVIPPQLAFSAASEVSQTLLVSDRRAKPLTVLRAGASSPELTVEIGAIAASADGVRGQPITVRLAGNAIAGQREEMITLLTDDPEYPELRIPVRVVKRVAGAVVAAPATVAVRLAPGQDEVSTLVQLRSPDGKPVSVAGAESDNPAVTVKWSPGSGPVATVRVTVAGANAMGSGMVRVRLAEPAGQEVLIPVSWSGGRQP